MPAKNLHVPERIRKRVYKLPKKIQERIAIILFELKSNPLSGFKLKGELGNYHKIRIGDYRIVYKFDAKLSLVEVVKVEHRQGVYK